ncbi:uncharacterized protein LOC119682125 [Teleopsis dalmanni]|uniref:uncharacterized protein LOC119682125 n=1 Tax=Teleopsis dalmanni TaxID=139649 RepID=UPI0018CE9E93|nr:uncharacterized protein LOC119682125 [Teleopsis dalmanni]XP_037951420.1 uncharacterized protein LOC119682125 [Teleopsis dalmanni]
MRSQQNKFLYKILILIITATSLSTVAAVNCPQKCRCSWVLDSLEVNCAHQQLSEYPNFSDLPIQHLDLSHNLFVEFPTYLADIESLISLDLSNNNISYLYTDALVGFSSLRTLILANNSINSWEDINPNEVFLNAISLKRLSLSGNLLYTFTADDELYTLASESINVLELEKCGITDVNGDILVNSLPNLERLGLSHNSINSIPTLPSRSLRKLELNNCNVQQISSNLLRGLPNLEKLHLSGNTAIQLDDITSDSITEIDISYCNLDIVNLNGLPSLKIVKLRGNLLKSINAKSFANSTQLEMIDLSKNNLRLIENDTFSKLKHLTALDLSYNEIARLDRNLFRSNDILTTLNLSRNVIERLTKLISNSLRDINLSWCEIHAIETTALSGLTTIQRLDLSNNLLRDFPGGMRSETLQRLNLSNCRLSAIRNSTFRDFPELASLHLNGNRFTNPFSAKYFRSNKYLDAIWVGDNPWICNCHDTEFMDFYDYLVTKPQKLQDKISLRCASPSVLYGQTWEMSCANVWLPRQRNSSAEKVWTTILTSIMVIGVLIFCFTCFTKYMRKRKEENDVNEYRQNQEEMMEIRRLNQRILSEEASSTAASLRTSNLPSYEDALLMPKPERPIKSMWDLTAASRSRRKLHRTPTDPEGDPEDSDLLLDNRQRFRSEEMLSNRAKERTAQIEPFRRTGRIEHNPSGSRRFSIEDSRFPAAHLKSQNLQSAEKIGNFHGYDYSPYTKRKPKIAEIPPFKRATLLADSVEFLTDPEFDVNSKPGSPFARRKPKPSVSSIGDDCNVNIYANSSAIMLAPAIENYFAQKSNSNSPEGSDFHVVVEPDMTSLAEANSSSSSMLEGERDLERSKRKKLKNSSSRRASGNFNAAAAAADGDTSSSDREPMVIVHKPMRETLF